MSFNHGQEYCFIVLVRNGMGVNEHVRLSNLTLRHKLKSKNNECKI